MKLVNNLYHFTKSFDVLKSILQNGIYASYCIENFNGRKILIPMISFSNVQLRDVGDGEVINYGEYAIAISRETGIKFGLNPVQYIYSNSMGFNALFKLMNLGITPQILKVLKATFDKYPATLKGEKVSNHLKIDPLLEENKKLLDAIDSETSGALVEAIQEFGGVLFFEASKLILLSKPYKVYDKKGEEFIAYNDREWRKVFEKDEPIFHFEKNMSGVESKEFVQLEKDKPLLKDKEHTLQINLEMIEEIVVTTEGEKEHIIKVLNTKFGEVAVKDRIENEQLLIIIKEGGSKV
jgi:hypothetical protein